MARSVPTYDERGNRVDLRALKEEIAAPQLSGVRQIVSGHPADGITPVRLTQILREAEAGDAVAYLELAEAMEEKDLHYLSVLSTRKRQCAQLEITVEAATDEAGDIALADFVRDWLARDELEDDLIDILDAIGKGYSACEIVWEMSERQWWPARLEWRDPRWFEFDRVDGTTLMLKEAGLPKPLPPYKFVRHRVRAKSGLPIRGGLARAAAWGFLFKTYAVKDWVSFAEIFGLPFRVGKYDPNTATPSDIKTLMRAVAGVSSDAAAVISNSMDIDFVDGKQGGNTNFFESLANYLDRQVSKAVLGQTGTGDAIAGGYAVGKVHDEVRHDIEQSDARALAGTLNRDLVRPMVDLNFGRQDVYPRIVIGRAEQTDVTALTEALARVVPLGLKVEQSVVRDRMGLPDPDEGAELLGAPAAEPVPPAEEIETASATLCPVHGVVHATAGAAEHDMLDELAMTVGADWEPVMDPLFREVEQLLASAGTLEEARDRLAEIATSMDVSAAQTALGQAGFAARIAGAIGIELTEGDAALASDEEDAT